MPDYQPVYGSSIITGIAYHEPSKDCFVRFANGESYVYHDVPPEVWEELSNSPSKGKFVNLQLRRGYKYERSARLDSVPSEGKEEAKPDYTI